MSFLQLLGQAPQLAMSKQLMTQIAEMFEITNTRLVDELVALSQKMVQVNANQAGRNQGGSANGGGEQPGAMTSDAALSGVSGGM